MIEQWHLQDTEFISQFSYEVSDKSYILHYLPQKFVYTKLIFQIVRLYKNIARVFDG